MRGRRLSLQEMSNDEAHLATIGAISCVCGQIEIQTKMLAHHLIGADPEIGHAITSKFGSHTTIVDLISDLVALRLGPELDAKFKTLSGRLKVAATERNDILHALIFPGSESLIKVQFPRRKKLIETVGTITQAKLEKTLADMREVYKELTDFGFPLFKPTYSTRLERT